MDIETKLDLIKQPPMREVITEEELRSLLQTKDHPISYDGFEPSGQAHLGLGLVRAIKVQDLNEAGIKFKFLIADWFGWINNKMGGNLEKIKKVGEYFVEVWKALGVDFKKNEVIWTSSYLNDLDYWKRVISISKITTIQRMMRCSTIMGRKQGELQDSAQLLYPAMQVSDIFNLKCDMTQLGIDQRRANVLAREIGPKLKLWKPVVASHSLLIGLQGPQKMGGFEEDRELDVEISSKMSKSIPKSFISVHDSPSEIKEKIRGAFCPEKIIKNNPVMEICRMIIFRKLKLFGIKRPQKFGGPIEFFKYQDLEREFRNGKVHPLDLKNAVSDSLINILKPVRDHFEKHPQFLEVFKEAEITR